METAALVQGGPQRKEPKLGKEPKGRRPPPLPPPHRRGCSVAKMAPPPSPLSPPSFFPSPPSPSPSAAGRRSRCGRAGRRARRTTPASSSSPSKPARPASTRSSGPPITSSLGITSSTCSMSAKRSLAFPPLLASNSLTRK